MKEATARNKKNNKTFGYIALLHGINIGSNKQVKMEDLRRLFESMGFQSVRTIINSGNVVFEASEVAKGLLVKRIEEELTRAFGHEIPVILRTVSEIQDIADSNPFKKVKVTPEKRLYVTFLSDKPASSLKVPYESPDKDLKILSIQNDAVFYVVTVGAKRGTTDAMAVVEKQFGKR